MPTETEANESVQRLPRQFGQWVVRHRWLMIVAPLLLVAAGISGIPKTGFNSSYRVFFSAENPQLNAFDEFQAIYTKDDNVAVVIRHPKKPVFSNDVLETVRAVTAGLWKTSHVTRVDSITNYQHTAVDQDDLIVEDLVSDLPLTATELAEKERIALDEPLLSGLLLSRDGRVTQVNARVLFPPLDENPNVAREIYEEVEALIAAEQARHPEIEYRISGIVATNTAFSKTPEDEIKKMMPAMLVLIIGTMIFLVRTTAGVVFSLLMVLLSILFTLGLSGHVGIRLTPVSASFPQILLAVAIAYSIHMVVSYTRLRRDGHSREDSVVTALEKNLTPIFLTALTTAIGFLSMLLNEVPPVRHLGILVGIGVLFTFVVSVTLLPGLLAVCPCRVKPRQEAHGREQTGTEWTDRLGGFVLRHHTAIFYSLLGGALVVSFFITKLELSDNPINYFKKGTWFRDVADFVDDNLTGVSYTDYSLDSKTPDGITDPEFLAKVKDFTEYARTIPEVVHVSSIVPIMKRLNKNLHGDEPAYYRLPESQELAAQYLLLYEMSLPFGLDLNNQINIDRSSTRVTVTTQKMSAKRHMAVLERVEQWAAERYPDLVVEGTGTWVMFTYLSDRVIRGMLQSLAVALLLITLVCIVTFRSLRLGLLSLVPNGLPIILTFGVWGMKGDYVDFAVSIVAVAALGIIVDDTIHLMVRYRRNRAAGMESDAAFLYSLKDVGHALLFTTIILVVGFGLFLLSGFRINSSMGIMISTSIALALFYDFVFLPGLLLRFDGKRALAGSPSRQTAPERST